MKLALGTAQFGMDYGINNPRGKIPKKEVFKILASALRNNIDTLDTAYSYGDSEKIIGEFIKENSTFFKIISKLPPGQEPSQAIEESLKRLNLNQLYAYLIHDFNHFLKKREIWSNLKKFKQQGKVQKIGFSLYYTQEIEFLLEKNIVPDIIQVPFSIFDQRFSKLFPFLKEKGVEIHVRSTFLQGLIFKKPEKLEGNFIKIKDKITTLNSLSQQLNTPISTICLNFATLNIYVDKVIVGIDNLENLQENISSLQQQNQIKDIYPQLLNLKENNENIILPSNWSKANQTKNMGIPNLVKNKEWLKKAKEITPSASQTYSKSYKYFCEGVGPAFLDYGQGSHVWDIDGNEYVDFVCGLGAITIGYNDLEVNKAISEQLQKGITFSQSNILEVKLAEKLIRIIPSAEMVRFVKNGSDATSAAIRVARAYTRKDLILCSGYHGFQDWYIGTKSDLGIPPQVKELIKPFEYNNIESLKKLLEENKGRVAAVIMEPMQGNGPQEGYLESVKRIVHENGAVLIFDEIVSGFRMALGGAQEYFKVVPDLSCFGKGMGNGLPLSALVGKKELIRLIDEGAFVSMTFGGETLSLAGTLTVISILERPGTFEHIRKLGNAWIKSMQDLIDRKRLKEVAEIIGDQHHPGIKFKNINNLSSNDLFSVFQQSLLKNGILGLIINNFCLAHTQEDIEKYLKAADLGFDEVLKAIEQNSTENILMGKPFRPIFKRV